MAEGQLPPPKFSKDALFFVIFSPGLPLIPVSTNPPNPPPPPLASPCVQPWATALLIFPMAPNATTLSHIGLLYKSNTVDLLIFACLDFREFVIFWTFRELSI